MLQSVLCITTNKYLVGVLVVLLHAHFSVVSPIPFLLAAIFFRGHPYIGSTTVLPDTCTHINYIVFVNVNVFVQNLFLLMYVACYATMYVCKYL